MVEVSDQSGSTPIEYGMHRLKDIFSKHAFNNLLVVGAMTTLFDGLALPNIFAKGRQAVESAMELNPVNSTTHLDLEPLQKAYEKTGDLNFFNWAHLPDIGTLLLGLDVFSSSITFPDYTAEGHDNRAIQFIAKWHNFWNKLPQEHNSWDIPWHITRDIIRSIKFGIVYSTSHTLDLLPGTLHAIIYGAEVDSSAYVPAALFMLTGLITAYDLVVITASIAQHLHPKPGLDEDQPLLGTSTQPSLPIPKSNKQLTPPKTETEPMLQQPSHKRRKSLPSPPPSSTLKLPTRSSEPGQKRLPPPKK